MGNCCSHPSSSNDEQVVDEDSCSEDIANLPVVSQQAESPTLKPRPKQKVVRPEGLWLPLRKMPAQSPWAAHSGVERRDHFERANFNGLWSCFEILGDMDALLVSLEVSWAKRCAASAINYGAGYVSRRIAQRIDEMEMEVIGTPSDFTQNFRVGFGWQRVLGPDGDLRINPYWEAFGQILCIDQTELDGSSPVTLRHQLQDFGMVICMTAMDGVSASWKFRRE